LTSCAGNREKQGSTGISTDGCVDFQPVIEQKGNNTTGIGRGRTLRRGNRARKVQQIATLTVCGVQKRWFGIQ
jgi:hypothetical protein